MSLTQVSERVHVWQGAVNFGIIVGEDRQLILVDSGLDSQAARKALRPFLESGHRLAAIINTHSHADHIGGNADLIRRSKEEPPLVWAPAKEIPFIRWPELEPLGLYGGAWPHPGLQTKFLRAEPTPAELLRELPLNQFRLAGVDLELVPVPGHALDQVAFAVDGVLLAADGLFHPEIIAKHPVIFLVNVAEYLSSLERIAGRPERYVLPGHGPLIDRAAHGTDPLPGILEANHMALRRIQEAILAALAEPMDLEELLFRVVRALGKQHEGEPSYFLDRAAISAHLTHLMEQGLVNSAFAEGRRFLSR